MKATFQERLSTGYYLPAGIEMSVKVTNGNHKGWKLRIGAHTDNNTNLKKYVRWPVVSIMKLLDEEMVVSSPFGGLVYFER